MNLYVPRPGDLIRLVRDWEFTVYNEHRNESLITFIGRKFSWSWDVNCASITKTVIPAGSVLKIDRVYIRKGTPDFDSITFMWVGQKLPPKTEEVNGRTVRTSAKPIRFWAKLDEARTIEFEPV